MHDPSMWLIQVWVSYLPKALATSPGQLQPPSCTEREVMSVTGQIVSFIILPVLEDVGCPLVAATQYYYQHLKQNARYYGFTLYLKAKHPQNEQINLSE